MLRITQFDSDDGRVTLRVEGQLLSQWVSELERETRRLLQSNRRVILDLEGVNFIGATGMKMLKEVAAENVEIVNRPALIDDFFREKQDLG